MSVRYGIDRGGKLKKFRFILLAIVLAFSLVLTSCKARPIVPDSDQNQPGEDGDNVKPGGDPEPDVPDEPEVPDVPDVPDPDEGEEPGYSINLYPAEGFDDLLPPGAASLPLSSTPYNNIGSYAVDNHASVVKDGENPVLKLSYSEGGGKGYSGAFAKIDFSKTGAGKYVLRMDVKKSAGYAEDRVYYKDSIGYRLQNSIYGDRQFEDNYFYDYDTLRESVSLPGWKHLEREFVLYDISGFDDFQIWYNTNFADPEKSYLYFDNIEIRRLYPEKSAPSTDTRLRTYKQASGSNVTFSIQTKGKPLKKVTIEGETLPSYAFGWFEEGNTAKLTLSDMTLREYSSGYKAVTVETTGGVLDLAVQVIPRYARPADVFQTDTYNGMDFAYYVPAGYDESKAYPVITYLHGIGECGTGNSQLNVANEILVTLTQNPKYMEEAIIFAPQCPSMYEPWNTDRISDLVVKCLDEKIIKRFNVDQSRLYITGISLGGFGTWYTIARYPEKFAAAVPVCGGIYLSDEQLSRLDMPIWTFHSKYDDTVDVNLTRNLCQKLTEQGKEVIFTEYDEHTKYNGVVLHHNAWVKCYNEEATFDWMLSRYKI